MVRGGVQPFAAFEEKLLLPAAFTARPKPELGVDRHADRAVEWVQGERPSRQNFWPALTLAFVAQVEAALAALNVESAADLLADGRITETTLAGEPIQQLEFDLGEAGTVSCRRFYNAAAHVVRVEMRRTHPSAPGHATSRWRGYSDFIELLGSMTPGGRHRVADFIWTEGVLPLPEILPAAGRSRRPRPFLRLVRDLDTSSGSHGGALFQAMVYAYLSADSPYLTVVSHRVNVGSSRAGALGDVDGYLGEEVVLAAEAKDKALSMSDEEDLLTFIEDVSPYPDVDAVVFARDFDQDVRAWLSSLGIRSVSRHDMQSVIALWDIPKQQNAGRAMRFFLANIQKQPALLARVVDFIDDLNREDQGAQPQAVRDALND